MEVISCHGASQEGPKKLSRFMREVTLARNMKISCDGLMGYHLNELVFNCAEPLN